MTKHEKRQWTILRATAAINKASDLFKDIEIMLSDCDSDHLNSAWTNIDDAIDNLRRTKSEAEVGGL